MKIEEVSLGEYNAHHINSIKREGHKLRSASKAPTFALQYAGTYLTLMNNCGFSEAEARQIEANYHETYKVADQYTADRITEATINGFVKVAFGLKVRTPLLGQVILGNKQTPQEAQGESRSAGNALFQSYGLLNGRASEEFMRRVRASEYRYRIHLCAQIHDAIYLYWEDSLDITLWINTNLIDCMRWHDLPELQDANIKLSSELDIAYPTWADTVTIPNEITKETLIELLNTERNKRWKSKQGT
jgi:DNA polymerase-1